MLPATRHKWTRPAFTQPVSRYSIYLPRRDGRLSWPRLPGNARPGTELATSRSRVRRPTTTLTEQPIVYLKRNTRHWRRCAQLLSSWVTLESAVCIEFATSSRRLPTDLVEKLLSLVESCWAVCTQFSFLQPTRLDKFSACLVFKNFSTKSVVSNVGTDLHLFSPHQCAILCS